MQPSDRKVTLIKMKVIEFDFLAAEESKENNPMHKKWKKKVVLHTENSLDLPAYLLIELFLPNS